MTPLPDDLPVLADSREWSQPLIYGLVAADEPTRIRYIGKSRYPRSRFYSYVSMNGCGSKLAEWLTELFEQNGAVLMVCVEKVTADELEEAELRWIKSYNDAGMADLNMAIPPRSHRSRKRS